jgi:hypothetical protein
VGVFAGPDVVDSGLVLSLDAANSKSYFGYWSPTLSNGANAFDGSLSTVAGSLGGTFGPYTYTFTKPPSITSARMYVSLGASSGQVGSRTNVFLVNGIDVTQKAKDANLYAPTAGWIDVTAESGSNWNTFQFTGTSGSTNPSIAAIEVNGNILVGNYSGTTWTDLSGNSNTGTLTNGPTYSSANGGSIVFDGSNDNIQLAGTNFSLNTMTISAWNYSSNFNQNGFMFEKTTNGAVNTQYSLFYNSSNDIYYRTYGLSTLDLAVNTTTAGVVNNQWNNVVATWDGTNKRIYVNGVLRATSATLSGTVTQNTTGAAFIGIYGGGGYPFNGRISQTQIYNRALTAQEIQQNYNASKSRYGL